MDLTRTDQIAAPPADVVAQLTDRDYLVAYCAELHAAMQQADVGRDGDCVQTRLVAAVATDSVPAVFRSIVGDSVTVDDRRTYRTDGTGCDIDVTASFAGRPVTVVGTMTFDAADGGTALRTQATISAKVPLLGGRIEAALHDLLEQGVLAAQATMLRRRLGC